MAKSIGGNVEGITNGPKQPNGSGANTDQLDGNVSGKNGKPITTNPTTGTTDNPHDPGTIGGGATNRGNKATAETTSGGTRKTVGAKQTKSKSTKLDLNKASLKNLSSQIVGVHKIAGILTGTGELCEITDDQAEAMTEAVTAVMAQHKIKPNPKAVAWVNLVSIMGVIYTPKILLYRDAKKMMRAKQMQQVNPHQMPTQPPPTNGGAPHLKFV